MEVIPLAFLKTPKKTKLPDKSRSLFKQVNL